MIAGHLFAQEGRCNCSMRFGDISGALPEHIGKDGWAHTRELTETEYQQIVAERNRIWALVIGVSTGGGPVQSSPPIHDDAYFG